MINDAKKSVALFLSVRVVRVERAYVRVLRLNLKNPLHSLSSLSSCIWMWLSPLSSPVFFSQLKLYSLVSLQNCEIQIEAGLSSLSSFWDIRPRKFLG